MISNQSAYFFNVDAIIIGGTTLFVMLIFHAIYMFLVNKQYEKLTDRFISHERYGSVHAIFYVMAFILVGSHLSEIFMWGYMLNFFGLVSNAHEAMLFAGSTYTTLGYGVNPLPVSWDLIMVMIALNGMVAFGWSISVLFQMSQIATAARLHQRSRR
jgi:hypothetical protein